MAADRISTRSRLPLSLAAASLFVLIATRVYAGLTDLFPEGPRWAFVYDLNAIATAILAVAIVWLHLISRRYWVYGGAFIVTFGVFVGGILWPLGVFIGPAIAGLGAILLFGWSRWRREQPPVTGYREALIWLAVSLAVGVLANLSAWGKYHEVHMFFVVPLGQVLPIAALVALFCMFAQGKLLSSPAPAVVLLAAGALASIPFVWAVQRYPHIPGVDELVEDATLGLLGSAPAALLLVGLCLLWMWIEHRFKSRENPTP